MSNPIFKKQERPISFNAEMVRVLRSGQKTQTRRTIKPENIYSSCLDHILYCNTLSQEDRQTLLNICPYGKPGDFLWVRETWQSHSVAEDFMDFIDPGDAHIMHYFYAADGNNPEFRPEESIPRWIPGAFMPRWASSIVRQINDVRIERLHCISEDDLIHEGIAQNEPEKRNRFQELWERTGGIWIENPWVWIIGFKRVEKNSQPSKVKPRPGAISL